MNGENIMFIISGGISAESLKRIAAQVHQPYSAVIVDAFCHRIDEIFGKMVEEKPKRSQ
jgi:hypothetical protein